MTVQNSVVSGWRAVRRANAFVSQHLNDAAFDNFSDEDYDELVRLLQEAYDTGFVDCEDAHDF